jgi:hypothetical protein
MGVGKSNQILSASERKEREKWRQEPRSGGWGTAQGAFLTLIARIILLELSE